MTISIIIPTLNEAEYIDATLNKIYENQSGLTQLEVIVVDSGSIDHTLSQIKRSEVTVFECPDFKGKKYESLNYGASHATGEILLFLDADTHVPVNFDKHIVEAISKPGVVGGAFEYEADSSQWVYKSIQLINRIRYRLDRCYFGDQGIFCLSKTFDQVGGIPQKPIMEAAYFSRKMRERSNKTVLIKAPVITSVRRFRERGVLSVFFSDACIWILFLLGRDVSHFAQQYWNHNNSINN